MILIHWIRSLFHRWIRNSLRVIQKAEGGKRTFYFSFFYEKKRELSKEVETESKGTIFQKRDHTEIEEHSMHRNRGVLPSFNAGMAAQESSTVCI